SGNLSALDGLGISAEAKARITNAAQQGLQVTVPSQMVLLNGAPTIAWYEQNPSTGEIVGVTEDGGHQAIQEWQVVLAAVALAAGILYAFRGQVLGAIAANFAVATYRGCVGAGTNANACFQSLKNDINRMK